MAWNLSLGSIKAALTGRPSKIPDTVVSVPAAPTASAPISKVVPAAAQPVQLVWDDETLEKKVASIVSGLKIYISTLLKDSGIAVQTCIDAAGFTSASIVHKTEAHLLPEIGVDHVIKKGEHYLRINNGRSREDQYVDLSEIDTENVSVFYQDVAKIVIDKLLSGAEQKMARSENRPAVISPAYSFRNVVVAAP
jgi:hypothetical protein